VALPRLKSRSKANQPEVLENNRVEEKPAGFFRTFERMFEHQVALMFKDDLVH